MISGLVMGLLAAAVLLVGRAAWRSADQWAAQAWEDPGEQERKRDSLRRGAIACWVAAGALALGGVVSAVADILE